MEPKKGNSFQIKRPAFRVGEQYTDKFLNSDRSPLNVHRMASNWRPIWSAFFREFKNVQFVIHHTHPEIKLKLPENARVEVGTRHWTP